MNVTRTMRAASRAISTPRSASVARACSPTLAAATAASQVRRRRLPSSDTSVPCAIASCVHSASVRPTTRSIAKRWNSMHRSALGSGDSAASARAARMFDSQSSNRPRGIACIDQRRGVCHRYRPIESASSARAAIATSDRATSKRGARGHDRRRGAPREEGVR